MFPPVHNQPQIANRSVEERFDIQQPSRMNSMKQRLMLLALPLLIACGGNDTDTAGDAAKDTTAAATTASSGSTESTTGSSAGKMYEVKSGMYEMKNSMMEGMVQTIYFDDYGAKQATFSTAEMMGVKTENVQITKDGWNVSYDVKSKKGSKMKVPAAAGSSLVPKLSDLTDELKAKYEYKELESKTILGKETMGYSMNAMGMKVKAWTWNNIPLYMEMDMGQGAPVIMEVTKLETDIDVPADKFEVPADVTVEEIDLNKALQSTGK
jgi:outer membrane lipoprotein-sorting protein